MTGNHRKRDAIDDTGDAVRPSFCEFDAINAGEQIDSIGRQADLVDNVRLHKGFGRQSAPRRPESLQRLPEPGRIFSRGTHPEVDVSGGARQAVTCDRVGSNE